MAKFSINGPIFFLYGCMFGWSHHSNVVTTSLRNVKYSVSPCHSCGYEFYKDKRLSYCTWKTRISGVWLSEWWSKDKIHRTAVDQEWHLPEKSLFSLQMMLHWITFCISKLYVIQRPKLHNIRNVTICRPGFEIKSYLIIYRSKEGTFVFFWSSFMYLCFRFAMNSSCKFTG